MSRLSQRSSPLGRRAIYDRHCRPRKIGYKRVDMPYIPADTLDDLVRHVIEAIKARGRRIKPSRGLATEITGVLLELSNPLARLSTTEERGKLFSCLGEFCWYISKRKDLAFVSYYIPNYRDHVTVECGDVVGAYGPRLFGGDGFDQMAAALETLRAKPDTRNAVVVMLRADDFVGEHREAPCTCTLQMFLRDSRLDMVATMRSNDAYMGLIHDAFAFTMLQEMAARTLGVELGTYKHFVGSLHLYDKDRAGVESLLREGWQPTTTAAMPPMPQGDPWRSIELFLHAEEALRTTGCYEAERYSSLDPYWLDLIRLLRVVHHKLENSTEGILKVRNEITFAGYVPFIDGLLERMDTKTQRQRRTSSRKEA